MQITVAQLRDYLDSYPPDATIKFAVNQPDHAHNNLTECLDYGFISQPGCSEDCCKDMNEVIIHPYFN